MQSIGGWNDSAFSDKPFDAEASKSFLERLPALTRSESEIVAGLGPSLRQQADYVRTLQGPRDLAAAFSAAEATTRLTATSSARAAAHEGWYDDAIGKIKDATGVALDNPLMRNTSELAGRIGRGEFTGWNDPRLNALVTGREDAFLARARELKAQAPDKLAGLDLDTPVPQQARGLAKAAQQQAEALSARAVNPVAAIAGTLGGAIYGSRRDPLFWLSFMAPAGGAGATALTRVGHAALTQGLANAALSGVAQPTIQAWREEAGLPNGMGEALAEVAMAGVVGGALGGALRGAGESLPALRKLLDGRATKAERESLAAAGLHVSEADHDAIGQAAKSAAADAELLKAPPHLPEQEARVAYAEALARAEDPAQPPPLPRPAPTGASADAFSAYRAALDARPGQVEAHARAAAPEAFARAADLDMRIEQARAALDDMLARQDAAPPALAENRLAALQSELEAMTGKRRSSPAALALKGEIERIASSAADVAASASERLASDIQAQRLRLNDLQQQRAEAGVSLNAARRAAEAATPTPAAPAMGHDNPAVREAMRAPDLDQAIAALRAADGVEAALSSSDPVLRDLGRLASLDAAALDLVRAGEVRPVHAAIVAANTDDPPARAALLSLLREAKPESAIEARIVISDHVAAANAVESAAARMGVEPRLPPPAAAPTPRAPGDLLGHVPMADADGTARVVTRDMLANVSAAERRWADVVSACKS